MPHKPVKLPHEKPKLKRSLGLFEVTIYGIGIILGAGIYAIIGEAGAIAGNTLWLAFLIGAIIAMFSGLSYAELGSMYPKEAAEFIYLKKALKSKAIPFLVGWLIIFIGITAGATVALGFGGYFHAITGFNPILAAFGLMIILSLLNFYGIQESAKVNVIFTIVELAGLLLIIFLGINYFGTVNYFEFPSEGIQGVFLASILVFFAYIGFEDIVNVAEETKKPRKVIPKAIIISVVVSTILYILVSISVVSIMPWQELGESKAPLAAVSEAAWPGSALLLSIIALFATANTVLIILIVSSRMVWGMANHGSFPKILSKIHHGRKTPWIAIILIFFVSIGFIMIGDIRVVAEMTNLGSFLVFLSVNVALIWLRYKKPKVRRPFRSPINIGKFPVLAFLGGLFCFLMLFYFELTVIMFGMVVLAIGYGVYLFLNRPIQKFK